MRYIAQWLLSGSLLVFLNPLAYAHGIAGNRYFPPTIVVEDPYAANEVHAVAGRSANIGAGNTNTSAGDIGLAGIGIEPLDGFGIAINGLYRSPNGNLMPQASGFDNLYYTVKQELHISDAHEFAVSFGVLGQAGKTGSRGGDTYSTYAPTIFYAKGFGDLPNSLSLLKPLAITGVLGYQVPTEQSLPKVFNWGFTVQYSLPYLNQFIQKTGWNDFFNRLVPVVELPMQTCLSGRCTGQLIGSVNPGVIWVGDSFNVSAEAVFPVNSQSGASNGFLLQIHKYLGR